MASAKQIDAATEAINAYLNRAIDRMPSFFRGSARKFMTTEQGGGELWQAVREALEAAEKVKD